MFRDLTGVDPFIKEDIHYSSGLRVLKKSLFEVDDQYDLITLHHSYEHMPEPLVVMKQLHRLTKEGGTVLIRIPLADSYAWRTYGVDWLQLDAPRHIYLHTCKSIERIAKQSGFHIKDIVYDSDAEQFLGSEQYKRDIPLNDERSYEVNPEGCIFAEEEIMRFRELAEECNKKREGDQACFYLARE